MVFTSVCQLEHLFKELKQPFEQFQHPFSTYPFERRNNCNRNQIFLNIMANMTRQALAKESILVEKTITEPIKQTGAISREKIAAVVSYVYSHACNRSTVIILPWQQLFDRKNR